MNHYFSPDFIIDPTSSVDVFKLWREESDQCGTTSDWGIFATMELAEMYVREHSNHFRGYRYGVSTVQLKGLRQL